MRITVAISVAASLGVLAKVAATEMYMIFMPLTIDKVFFV